MAEKRKHEDNEPNNEKRKKFKKTQKHHTKKRESKSQTTENTENSKIVLTRNEKIKTQPPKTTQCVLKASDVNKDNKNQAQNKSGKKNKMWKHWERRKNLRKTKEMNKKDSVDSTSSQTSAKSVEKESRKVMEKKVDSKVLTTKKQPEAVSCNWKKLKLDLKKTKPRKNFKKKSMKKTDKTKPDKNETESIQPEIWFDDVDEELLNPKKDFQANKQATTKPVSRAAKSADGLVKEHAYKGLTKAVALDCEMVGVGDGGKESVLARVSVVNQYGECLYDTFVRSREDVVDYRTQWSGVTPEKLENATDFLDAQKHVSDLLRGRVLVGHAVHHDLKVLFLNHPHKDIRDTSHYKPYKQMFKGRTPSLKNLTSRLLDVKIQTGEHNSVTDAQAAMRLYTFSRKEWEGHLKKRRIRKPKSSAKEKTKNV